jgi:pimeloyl-ACP methyl ester carboxylesterase
MSALVKALGYDQVDVLGYSLGGGVAFRLAIQHPEVIRRLVIVSAGFARDGFYPEMVPMQAQVGAAIAEAMKDTPMHQSYIAIASRLNQFHRLLDRIGTLMRKPMPVMLV